MSTQLEEKIKHTWSNKDNVDFYKLLPIGDFKDFATRVGIANGEDVEQIRNLVLNANSILEFGGGYGRVIDKLIEINPKAHITTIERNERLANYLNNKYSGKVDVIMADVLDAQISEKFDLILMMWSSFGEFPPCDQKDVFNLFSKRINKKGYLIIDLANKNTKHPYVHVDGKHAKYQVFCYNYYTYLPDEAELQTYAQNTSLNLNGRIAYTTTVGLFRRVIIFEKS